MADKCICSFWTSFKIQLLRHFDCEFRAKVCVCLTSCFSWNSDMSIRMKPCIKERQNLVICPSREANNLKRRLIYWLTFLMSLCMYRATCLASSVLPAKTVKHLLASMQFISSNNKTRNDRNITAVTSQTEFDEDASGFDSLWRYCSIRCWGLSVRQDDYFQSGREIASCRVFILLASHGMCVRHLSLPSFFSQGNVVCESKYRSYEF